MKNRKGFTITELVIVIAVIAILAAVLIPTFSGIIGKANDSATLQEARNMYTNYMGEFDYTDGTPATDLVIKVDGKYVAVKDGQMGDKIYDTLATAKNNADNAATVICDKHANVAPQGGSADAYCDDCLTCVVHTWTDADAAGTACTNNGCDETKPAA